MELVPFKSVLKVPKGNGFFSDVLAGSEFIDVRDKFVFESLRVLNKSWYRGMSGFMYDACMKFGFDKHYRIVDLEFRRPFDFSEGLFFDGKNLFLPTLIAATNWLNQIGLEFNEMDVGIEVPKLGISFWSNYYAGDLNVELSGVTVHFEDCK